MWKYYTELNGVEYCVEVSDDDRMKLLERFDLSNAGLDRRDVHRLKISFPCPYCERYNTEDHIHEGTPCVGCPMSFNEERYGCMHLLRAFVEKNARFARPVREIAGFGRESVSWSIEHHRDAVKVMRILHTFFAYHGNRQPDKESKDEG